MTNRLYSSPDEKRGPGQAALSPDTSFQRVDDIAAAKIRPHAFTNCRYRHRGVVDEGERAKNCI
jgi:hypothetical protein